jgi:hypothetical protein
VGGFLLLSKAFLTVCKHFDLMLIRDGRDGSPTTLDSFLNGMVFKARKRNTVVSAAIQIETNQSDGYGTVVRRDQY